MPANLESMEKLTTRSSPAALKTARDFLVKQEHPDLLVSRLGRQPTADEVQAATRRTQVILQADWRGLNEFLAPYELPAPLERRAEERQRRKAAGPGQDAAAAMAVLKIAQKELQRAFGPMWRRLPATEREQLPYEVYSRWLAQRPVGQPTAADLQTIVCAVYLESRAHEKEQGLGAEVDKQGPAHTSVDEVVDETSPRSRALAALRAGDESDRLQALLVDLHMGTFILPNQPARLTGQAPVRDLEKKHPGGGVDCPTCRAIARVVRARRLTPDVVGRAVDDFTIRLQEELGG